MTKIFKHLAKHWAACLVIIALLLVQAYGDLTLPDYTSKIVDTGIQQSGIADAVPEVGVGRFDDHGDFLFAAHGAPGQHAGQQRRQQQDTDPFPLFHTLASLLSAGTHGIRTVTAVPTSNSLRMVMP